MATNNTLLSIGMITKEALAVLSNEITFTSRVNRSFDSRFAVSGAKIGDTINIRKPPRYVGRRTATLNVEGTVETSVPLTLDKQYGTDISFTTAELALDIDDFSERVIKPAVVTVANMIDFDGLQEYVNIYNAVGSPGTAPTTLETYLDAGVKLDNEAAPMGMRCICLNPQSQAKIVNGLSNLFNPNREISDQYLKGSMGTAAGFDWYMDQNIGVHTAGLYAADVAGGAVTVNGAVTSGSSVVLAGWTSGDVLNQGDIITFENVFAVNPQNRQSTGQLRQFVVTQTATADGAGAMTVSVSPAIVFSGSDQTVKSATDSIANGAVLNTFFSSGVSSPQNLAFCKDAFAFGTAPLEKAAAAESSTATSNDLNMSIRVTTFYDGINDRNITRLDFLGGWTTLRPELAVRIAS